MNTKKQDQSHKLTEIFSMRELHEVAGGCYQQNYDGLDSGFIHRGGKRFDFEY